MIGTMATAAYVSLIVRLFALQPGVNDSLFTLIKFSIDDKKDSVFCAHSVQKTLGDRDRLIARLEGQAEVKHSQYSHQIEVLQTQVQQLTDSNKRQVSASRSGK